MLLRIDPDLTVVWRTLTELQIGAPATVAIVLVDDAWELELIELLRIGVEADRLWELAKTRAVPDATARLEVLLASVERAFDVQTRALHSADTIALTGEAQVCAQLAIQLGALGITVAERAPVTVIVDHFLAKPERYQPLLAADRPHVAVLCGDNEITISPLVRPGETACLFCWELHRRELDPEWHTVSIQLLRRRARGVSPLALARAALELVDVLHEERGELTVLGAQGVQRDRLRRHQNCGCGSLPGTVTAIADHARQLPPSSPPMRAALG